MSINITVIITIGPSQEATFLVFSPHSRILAIAIVSFLAYSLLIQSRPKALSSSD